MYVEDIKLFAKKKKRKCIGDSYTNKKIFCQDMGMESGTENMPYG